MNKSEGSSNSLAILCIAASASRHHDVEVMIDSFPPGSSPSQIADQLCKNEADLIGFSVNALNEHMICEVVRAIRGKSKSIYIVMGGPSASYSIQVRQVADFVVYGEGEDAVYELAEVFSNNAQGDLLNGKINLPGVSGRFDNHPDTTRFFCDLSKSPSPLVPTGNSKRFIPKNGNSYMYWETTRGCSYNCAFCCYNLNGRKFRELPHDRLAVELEYLKEYCTKHLFITDSVLGGRKPRTKRVLKMLAQLNVKKSVRLRAEYIDNELAELLFNANITYLDLGLQTTNPNLSWARSNDLEAMLKALVYLNNAKVMANLDLIIGFPGDSIQTMRESIRFAIETAKPNSIKIFPLKVYPGTVIHAKALSNGKKWLHYDPITCDTISAYSYTTKDFFELISYSNSTAKLYRFLNQNYPTNPLINKLSTYDRFFDFLKYQEDMDIEVFKLLHMPQNSFDSDSINRLWMSFSTS
jgi:radical SAM superfamily enzyme YgiQ (UPF0313 family)